jgi:hypothetical protein
MTEASETERTLRSAEQAWRTAYQARAEQSLAHDSASLISVLIASGNLPSPGGTGTPVSRSGNGSGYQASVPEEEQVLYERVVAAQALQRATLEWYRRVARRVETRLEEDDALYSALGAMANSTMIVFYPLVRWNVRSVLWEGEDPDADDDPIQTYCAARLGQETTVP